MRRGNIFKGGMSGERCAERPGSGMLLWQHEYYFVIEKHNGGPPKPYIYQALEFRKGSDLPEIEKENMTRKQLRATWVLARSGLCASP